MFPQKVEYGTLDSVSQKIGGCGTGSGHGPPKFPGRLRARLFGNPLSIFLATPLKEVGVAMPHDDVRRTYVRVSYDLRATINLTRLARARA